MEVQSSFCVFLFEGFFKYFRWFVFLGVLSLSGTGSQAIRLGGVSSELEGDSTLSVHYVRIFNIDLTS